MTEDEHRRAVVAILTDDLLSQHRATEPQESQAGGFALSGAEWSDDDHVSPSMVARLWCEGDDDTRAAIDRALEIRRREQYRAQTELPRIY